MFRPSDWCCANVFLFDSWLLSRDPKPVVPFGVTPRMARPLLAAIGLGTVRSRAVVHRGPQSIPGTCIVVKHEEPTLA